ncbi:MAG: alpha/beta fold hydrolase [Candidatus Binatia bacterium]|nr:alpha/beta fold hydrolase [Candidatus Binatia bacterium]
MSIENRKQFLKAINQGEGLEENLIYFLSFDEYKNFPDPFPRTAFAVREVKESVERYPNPERPGEKFRWDVHGRLLTPAEERIPGVAVVMIHGGAANEYEFLFTPDGPEDYLDLTRTPPGQSRVGIAQHMASLGVTVLSLSLPGHYSGRPWPPIATRVPEFIIGQVPNEKELHNRLSVYTFRMCLEAVKALIERSLPAHSLYIWGHSTGGEYFYLMERHGLKNRIIGGLGFGTGMPAGMRKEWDIAWGAGDAQQRAQRFLPIAGLSRRSPKGYVKSGYTGPNQPWGSVERWFELENHRRPQFKPFLQDLEHSGLDAVYPEVKEDSGLPDEELFITMKMDLTGLRGKKMLYFVGDHDKGHWLEGGERGLEFRREVFAFRRFAPYADRVRLAIIPQLTHYGHVESHNERLANLMVTALNDYFPAD